MGHELSDTQDLQERSLADILRQRFVNVSGKTGKLLKPMLPTERLYYYLLEEAKKQAALRSAAHDRPVRR